MSATVESSRFLAVLKQVRTSIMAGIKFLQINTAPTLSAQDQSALSKDLTLSDDSIPDG